MPSKNKVKLPVFLTEDEVNKLMSFIPSPRDLMLVRMMYYLGLRVSEALQAHVDDFDTKEAIYTIRAEVAKGKRERRVPIPEKFLPQAKAYLQLACTTGQLFDITPTRAWQILKSYGHKLNIKKRLSPHILRHSYATAIYALTKDLRLVQSLLGHQSIQTTAIYTHLVDEDKAKQVNAVFK